MPRPSWINKLTHRSKHSASSSTPLADSQDKRTPWGSDKKKGDDDHEEVDTSTAYSRPEPEGLDHYVLFTETFNVDDYHPEGETQKGRIRLHVLPGTDGTRFSPRQVGIDFSLDKQVITHPGRCYSTEDPNPHFVFPSEGCPTYEGRSMIYGTMDLPHERRKQLVRGSGYWTLEGGRKGWKHLGHATEEEGDIITRVEDHAPGFTEVAVHRGTVNCFREGKLLIAGPSGMDESFVPWERDAKSGKPLEQASYASQIVDSDPKNKVWPKVDLLSEKWSGNPTLFTYFDGEKTSAYISDNKRIFGLHGYDTPCPHAAQPEYTASAKFGSNTTACGEEGCHNIALHYALKLSHAEFIKAKTAVYDLTNAYVDGPPVHDHRSAAFAKAPIPREGHWQTEEVSLPGFDPTSSQGKSTGPIPVRDLEGGSEPVEQGFSLIGKNISNVYGGWDRKNSGEKAVIRFAQDGQVLEDGSRLVCAYSGNMWHQADHEEDKSGLLRLEKGEVVSEVNEGGHQSFWLRQGNWLVSPSIVNGASGLADGTLPGGLNESWGEKRPRGVAEDTQKNGETVLSLSADPSVRSFRMKDFDDKIKMLHGYQVPGTDQWNMRYFMLDDHGLDSQSAGAESKFTRGLPRDDDEEPPAYEA